MTALQTVATNATAERAAKRPKVQQMANSSTPVLAEVRTSVATAARSTADAEAQVDVVQRGQATAAKVTLGPRKAAEALVADVAKGLDAEVWVAKARAEAVVLSAPHSLQSMRSGLRAWGHFADRVLGAGGRHLPPTEAGLVAWSRLFRCAGTYSNYVSYVGMACDIAGVSAAATRGPLVRRAKTALEKQQRAPRERRFLERALTARLVSALLVQDVASAMLFLLSYAFLLRVPSEALPVQVGSVGGAGEPLPPGRHSCVGLRGGDLVLHLARRKNKPHGSTLVRSCWCAQCKVTCPVHVLGPWLASWPGGHRPFAHVSARAARVCLRRQLSALGVACAESYWLHDFRRGHTQDLVAGGSTLVDILRAGEWRTPAFMCYLDMAMLEKSAVVEAHQLESDSDSE